MPRPKTTGPRRVVFLPEWMDAQIVDIAAAGDMTYSQALTVTLNEFMENTPSSRRATTKTVSDAKKVAKKAATKKQAAPAASSKKRIKRG